MNAPIAIIAATDCPSIDDLARDYHIVVTSISSGLPGAIGSTNVPAMRAVVGYIGMVRSLTVGELPSLPIDLAGAYDYQSELFVDGQRRQITYKHAVVPSEGGGVETIRVYHAMACYRVGSLSKNVIAAIREAMIPAWDGCKTIRERATGIIRP